MRPSSSSLSFGEGGFDEDFEKISGWVIAVR